ncbi:MAG: glycosyltransferase [Raineya sp.]|nr:glycosyltransferase [Raineya sp.]
MRLCIVFPNPKSQSETFIRNHVVCLKPYKTLTGGFWAYKDEKGKSIFGGIWTEPLRILLKRLFPVIYAKIYTHFLVKFLQKHQITHLLAEYGVTGVKVMRACQKADVALIVHFHGFDASNKKVLQEYTSTYQEMFQIAKKIIVVSEDMKTTLMQLNAPENKILNIPCGINPDLFSEKQTFKNEKIIISVGRLTAKKSPMLNIKAFNEVLKVFPEAQFWIVGEGELRREAENLVKELKIEQNVKFWGYQTPEQISELLHKANVFIQHSITDVRGDTEGTPNTILEASCVGLPVVSTFHAGIKQAIEHEKTGFLVAEGDYLQMAEYIIYLLKNPEIAQQMGKSGRAKMLKEYNLPFQIEKLQKAIFE